MPKHDYDPFRLIPSAQAIRQRLSAILEQARRLRVLLRTAEQIEREADSDARRDAEGGGQ